MGLPLLPAYGSWLACHWPKNLLLVPPTWPAPQAAKAAGVPVFLDAGGVDAPLSDELLSSVALLSPNETELARLAKVPTGSDAEVEAAARALLTRGVPQVLVKLGADGSMLLPGAQLMGATCIGGPSWVVGT